MSMCEIPVAIDDDETLVRAAKVPQHLDKKLQKLRPAAFRQPPGRRDLSVMRHTYLGSDTCKAIAKEKFGEAYYGFGALTAKEIRKSPVELRDETYCGHADIRYGFVGTAGGQAAPQDFQMQYKRFSDAARFYPDPDIAADTWTGPEIQ